MQATERRERPIIFSGESVPAILDGRKTMTRRVIKQFNRDMGVGCGYEYRFPTVMLPDGPHDRVELPEWASNDLVARCPYGKPGDLLWVRETHRADELALRHDIVRYKADNACVPVDWESVEASDRWEHIYNYKAPKRWRPSIHMPRWASRITLEVTGVRVERVAEISRADAKAEGFLPSLGNGLENFSGKSYGNAQLAFSACWDSLNAKRGYSWNSNPWVWVVEFQRKEATQ